jgi:DNA-binding LacI/PurR family transcriptional regulator
MARRTPADDSHTMATVAGDPGGRVTAVVAFDDLLAHGVLTGRGVVVPRDFSVVG